MAIKWNNDTMNFEEENTKKKFNPNTMCFEDDEQKKSSPPKQDTSPSSTAYRETIWEKIGDFISDVWFWIDCLPGVLKVPLQLIIGLFILAVLGVLIEALFEILL